MIGLADVTALLAAAPLLDAERAALAGYRLHWVTSARDPLAADAYQHLAAYFGVRGELEARADWLRLIDRAQSPWLCEGVAVVRPLLVALTPDGALGAISERYVAYDDASSVLSALDANLLVLPGHRGTGLGPTLERLVIHAGRLLLSGHGAAGARRGLELGDLEPLPRCGPCDPDAVRRIAVWGRAGYALISPDVFPLSLLGMAAWGRDGSEAVPMLAVVRSGMSQVRTPTLHIRKAHLRTLAQHLYAAHQWTQVDAVRASRAQRLACIEAAKADPVPLFPLPLHPLHVIPDFLCLA